MCIRDRVLPIADGKTGQVRRAQGRCLNAPGAQHLGVQQIGLELHQEAVGAGAAIDLQAAQRQPSVLLHGPADIGDLVGQRLQRGPGQMSPTKAPGQADDCAPDVYKRQV